MLTLRSKRDQQLAEYEATNDGLQCLFSHVADIRSSKAML